MPPPHRCCQFSSDLQPAPRMPEFPAFGKNFRARAAHTIAGHIPLNLEPIEIGLVVIVHEAFLALVW